MRIAARITIVILVALMSSCTQTTPTSSQPIYDLFQRDWEYWMKEYPEVATQVGYPGHDGRWTDYSLKAIEARNEYLTRSVADLKALDRGGLAPGDQLNYDLYRGMLDTAVAGLAFDNDALPVRFVIPHNLNMPINQMEGIQQDIPRIISVMPTNSVAAYENIVRRLEGVPALVEQTIVLMEQGLARGITPPRVAMRDVPSQVEGQIKEAPLDSPMLAAFKNWPAAIGEDDRARLTVSASEVYRGRTAPAFRRLHQFLVEKYLPACRETIAAAALPQGAELYTYNVNWHTTTGLSAKEIHDIGQAEVKRIRAAMDSVIASAGYAGRFDDFVKMLRSNPKFYYTDADALVSGYRDVAKRADPELAKLFGVLPRTPYGVLPVPAAVAPSQTTAYYEPGSFDAGRPGNMYANTYKLEARPKYEMEALTLHEAVPGHHLQISLAQEMVGLPEFRRHSSYTAYVEGWALYSERLGEEMGFYKDPYSKFGQLTYEMWRAIRLVVDTGMHAMGWTRQQAIDFFLKNTAKTAQDITVEVDRYIVWPGQALGYKMGEIRIRELRAEAQKRLGNKFDVRGFHDEILGLGAVPLDVLEARVEAWVSSVK